MVVYCQQEVIGNKAVFSTRCERCGKDIGNLTGEEVLALGTGNYGPVLCYECEDNSCAVCHKELRPDEWQSERVCGEGDGVVCWFCAQEALQDESSLG